MQKSPDAFRTISEVAELLETPAHVLRFWESRFPQIRPVKRAGGRRYYRPADVALLTGIRRLLHDEGMTIRGVQKILREQGVQHVSGVVDDLDTAEDDAAIEAAVTASVGTTDGTVGVTPAVADSAQVIDLQTALRQVPDHAAEADAKRAPGNDAPPVLHAPPVLPAVTEGTDLFSRLPAAEPQDQAPALPDVSEAPMAVWAEETAQDVAPFPPSPDAQKAAAPASATAAVASGHPTPVAPPPAPAPVMTNSPQTDPNLTDPNPVAPTLAQRLRATRAKTLSLDTRATLAALRDAAQVLRDRMTAAPRGPL